MDYKLELVPLPVADVDRAKAFYAEKVGFVENLSTIAARAVSASSSSRRPGPPARSR